MEQNNYTPFALFRSLFFLPKQGLFKKLKNTLIFMLVYSVVIGFLDYRHNIIKDNTELGQFHLLFSFCLSIIISFRINSAYNRWWEARTLWGSLVNNMRNLVIKLNAYIGLTNDEELISFLKNFPIALKYHLRRDVSANSKILADLHLNEESQFPVTLLMTKIINKVNYYRKEDKINFEQFMVLDNHLSAMTDIIGGCERILNTPPPAGFSLFTRFALLFYILIFPFGWINSFGILITPIIMVLIYVLLGLEILAEEIEEPFGCDANDLPIDTIAERLVLQIDEIINTL